MQSAEIADAIVMSTDQTPKTVNSHDRDLAWQTTRCGGWVALACPSGLWMLTFPRTETMLRSGWILLSLKSADAEE